MLFARAALVDLMENLDGTTQYAGIIPVTKINKVRYWLLTSDKSSILSDFGCFSDGCSIYRTILDKLESISSSLAYVVHRSIRLHPERIMVWRKRIPDKYYPIDSFLVFVPIPPLRRITEEFNAKQSLNINSEIGSIRWCQPRSIFHPMNLQYLSAELLSFVNFWR